MFEFNIGTKIIFGAGASSRIGLILEEQNWNNIGLLIDHNLMDTKPIKELIKTISHVTKIRALESCKMSEPTYEYLELIRHRFSKKRLEGIVGIGGGSTIDTAKAMAVLFNNKQPAISYRGFNKMMEPVLPIIALPSTAGTGSEITPNASFIDDKEKIKMGINGEAVRPKYALIDPELTLSCPKNPTISAGLDSMVHAVEAFAAKKSNPFARMFAKEGLKYVRNNLLKVVKEPNNIVLRDKVMYGALLSGIALMNSGTGPAAAMSYPIGVHYGVSHGIAGGLFLPVVIENNIADGFFDYADLLEYEGEGKSKEHNAKRFLAEIKLLWEKLGLSSKIREYKISSDFNPVFVKETLKLRAALDQNPVPFYEEEIKTAFKYLTRV